MTSDSSLSNSENKLENSQLFNSPGRRIVSAPDTSDVILNNGVDSNLPPVISVEPNQIRWFYREPEKFWKPFCGADSILLEESLPTFGENFNPKNIVPVLGGMFEVDLHSRLMKPTYWCESRKATIVTRTWWFEVIGDSWLPFSEEESTVLESKHILFLQNERNEPCASRHLKDKVQIGDSEIIWYSSTEIRRSKLDIASKLLGFKGNSVKRGYKTLSTLSDNFPPIAHIVFVLHGVGQAMESASIIKCADSIRDISNVLCEKYFSTKSRSFRIEFIPVNWRTQLILDKGFVSKVTLSDAKGLRNMLNLSVGDVLYYTSAKFGPEILDSLLLQLNETYLKFVRKNPDFVSRGKVSVLAHSLGSVVMYDALFSTQKNQMNRKIDNQNSSEELTDNQKEISNLEDRLKKLKIKEQELRPNHLSSIYHSPECSSRLLSFSVEHFFAIGSPLSVFLILRNIDEFIDISKKSTSAFFPYDVCKRFYNIFHPADPITYRIEPIISEIYSQIRPIVIESASSKPSKEALVQSMGQYMPKIPQTKQSSMFSRIIPKLSTNYPNISSENINSKVLNDDSTVSFSERLTERLDFSLKEGMLESSHLNFLTAHTCYWESKDTILFILLQIYNFLGKPNY